MADKTGRNTDEGEVMLRKILISLLLCASVAWAGPDAPSKFDDSPLGSQKTVYQFNFEKP